MIIPVTPTHQTTQSTTTIARHQRKIKVSPLKKSNENSTTTETTLRKTLSRKFNYNDHRYPNFMIFNHSEHHKGIKIKSYRILLGYR